MEKTDLGLGGKRVIVTGAAGGLGRAFALAFAGAGARVMAADIALAGAEETAALIREACSARKVGETSTSTTCAASRKPGTPRQARSASAISVPLPGPSSASVKGAGAP